MDTIRGTPEKLEATVGTKFSMSRRSVRLHRQRGNALVESALVLPIMLALLMGITGFGLAINHYSVLTNITQTAAEQLAISRGTANPCQLVANVVDASELGLTQSQISYALAFAAPTTGVPSWGSPVTGTGSSFSCTGSATSMVQGEGIKLTVSIPTYSITVYGSSVFPITLQARVAEVVQ